MKELLTKISRENLVIFCYFLLKKVEKKNSRLFSEAMDELKELTED